MYHIVYVYVYEIYNFNCMNKLSNQLPNLYNAASVYYKRTTIIESIILSVHHRHRHRVCIVP